MEKMLNDYLQYAKSQSEESSSKIDINLMVNEILRNFDKNKFELKTGQTIIIEGRRNLIKRCIQNIIDNGLSYGNKVKIFTK